MSKHPSDHKAGIGAPLTATDALDNRPTMREIILHQPDGGP
jgi:hypothetical protein